MHTHILSFALWCLAAFLCGSIPFGLILMALAGKGDVRAQGSGNIGATNVLRSGGKTLGALTLLLDAAKGFGVVFVAGHCGHCGLPEEILPWLAFLAVAGHAFSPWLKFKGGKGVATGLGVVLALGWPLVVLPLATFLFVLCLTRYVSLGSVLAAFLLPLQVLTMDLALWAGFHMPMGACRILGYFLPLLLLAAVVIWRHRPNLQRLHSGTEARFGERSHA